jgi:hypothetical protein
MTVFSGLKQDNSSWAFFLTTELNFFGLFYCCSWIVVGFSLHTRRVWRYQRGNQNTYIEEEQTTQWRKEKGQKDKQRSTKYTHKTKDRVTRTPLKTRGELTCSGRVSSSCSTSDTRRVNLVTNPVKSHEWRNVYDKYNISMVICDTDIP